MSDDECLDKSWILLYGMWVSHGRHSWQLEAGDTPPAAMWPWDLDLGVSGWIVGFHVPSQRSTEQTVGEHKQVCRGCSRPTCTGDEEIVFVAGSTGFHVHIWNLYITDVTLLIFIYIDLLEHCNFKVLVHNVNISSLCNVVLLLHFRDQYCTF